MKRVWKFGAMLLGMLVSCVLFVSEPIESKANIYGKWQDTDGDGYSEVRCTWFAWEQSYNNTGTQLPNFGNAKDWLTSAKNAGYATGNTACANSIAVWDGGTYGHVTYVKSVSGTTMVVDEGGRTDLDHTSSAGVAYNQSAPATVGSDRWGLKLIGFIYLGTESLDTEAPIISNIVIKEINANGYTVACTVNDNVGVTQVKFPTWRACESSEGCNWTLGSQYGNTWVFTYTEAKYEDNYTTHIYAYDAAGNQSSVSAGMIYCQREEDIYPVVDGGIYEIESCRADDKVIDVCDASKEDHANIWLCYRNDSSAQRFRVEHVKDGYYKLTALCSGKVLDVYGGQRGNGVNLNQCTYNGTDAQLFRFVSAGDNYCYIISKLGSFVDLNGGHTESGTNIQMWWFGNTPNQMWKFNLKPEVPPTPTPEVPPTPTPEVTPTPTPEIPPTPTSEVIPTPTPEVTLTLQSPIDESKKKFKIVMTTLNVLKNIKRKKVKLMWKKISEAKGYQIQYATNKKFYKKKTKVVKRNICIIRKMKKKKIYYFRIRAYKMNGKKKIYGKWCKIKKIKVKI